MSYIPNIEGLEDLRLRVNKDTSKLTQEKLEDVLQASINSIEELVKQLVKAGAFYTHQERGGVFLTYASDIRFNYRDKYIYIPFTTYLNNIPSRVYEETYDKQPLLRRETVDYYGIKGVSKRYYLYPKYLITTYNQYLADESTVTFLLNEEHYAFDTSTLPLTVETTRSLKQCHQYYLDLHKGYDQDYKRYIALDGNLVSRERKLRKKEDLQKYLAYNTITYNDIRFFPHQELKGYVSDVDKPYKERLLDFEMYVYMLGNTEHSIVEQEEEDRYNEFRITKRFFKYGEHYPLILKWYYYNHEKFKAKSYEYFVADNV